MKQYLLFAALLIIPNILIAKSYPDVAVAKVISVYDGDTFRVNIDGYPALIGENISIRVNGVDTPEIRAKCNDEKTLALAAKEYTLKQLSNANTILLTNIERGKYFRLVADVIIDGKNLSELLISNNLGKQYQGGKRQSWCQ